MPGIAAARPDIAQAIQRHQPFPGKPPWLAHLVALTNENKHRRLTPQTRDETRWVEVQHSSGASVGFQPFQPGKGGVSFPGAQVFMNGVEVDPATLQPLRGTTKPYTETIYVDWLFEDLAISVLKTVDEIQTRVRDAVADICHVATL